MSSTTIIMKAFDDLNMRHRKFTSQVLAVLIVEDLFAVVLLVVLSSIAVNNSVSGSELLWSICKLLFFLIFGFWSVCMPSHRSYLANASISPMSYCSFFQSGYAS